MRREPGSPAEWMRYANGDLALARGPIPGIMLEILCFHAQQAAEKAIKAVLIEKGVRFSKIHVLERLIDLLPADIPRTADLLASASLTEYASVTRYLGMDEPVSEEAYRDAVRLAEAVVKWAEDILSQSGAL